MRIELDFPDHLSECHRRSAEQAAREAAVWRLFQDAAISTGRAAQLLGLGIEAFMKMASARGLPVFRSDPADLPAEIEAATRAASFHP